MTEPGPSINDDVDNVKVIDFDEEGLVAYVESEPLDDPAHGVSGGFGSRVVKGMLGDGAGGDEDARARAGLFGEPNRMRVGWLGSLAAAMFAMLALISPLWWSARKVPNEPAVLPPESLVVITTDTDRTILHGATLSKRALISFVDDQAETVAFTLSNADRAIVSERIDSRGPEFDYLTDRADEPLALDTRKLENGTYEMHVTATNADEVSSYTAARFRIVNP